MGRYAGTGLIEGAAEQMRFILTVIFTLLIIIPFDAGALDLGTPPLSEPLQKENFFDTKRLLIGGESISSKPVFVPQLSFSHNSREENVGVGVNQKFHSISGEAGGKLNLGSDVSLTAVTRMPVYSYEITENNRTLDGTASGELLKRPARLSWRSELGVPIGEGVNLNFFYDNSTVGKMDKPGLEERDEKFGTRFILKFK
jgi:hypothetical protein